MKSLLFDFESGQHVLQDGTPMVCSGVDAIKQWLQLMLRTRPDSVPIYQLTAPAFGVDLDALIGRRELPTDFVRAEVERQIREACAINPEIAGVSDFIFKRAGRHALSISFTVTLTDGETGEVIFDAG